MSRKARCISVRPASSLADENQVRSFNMFTSSCKGQTNQPQRIQLPVFFNTPIRRMKLHVKKKELQSLEKTTDLRNTKNWNTPEMTTFLHSVRRLRDYEMLAFACKRAGKFRDEGRAYYSMGVLYDNLEKWPQAIKSYEKFLKICKQIEDTHGEGLAYNCIGVDYQMMAGASENPKLFEKAIHFHKLHEDIGDVNSKFLASINLGLCYESDQAMSMFYYQQALKYAVNMSSLVGQTIAIGNIGKIGKKGLYDNTEKMKNFLEKYLQLAKEMRDQEGLALGHMKLGTVSALRGNFVEGKENFQRALNLAQNDRTLYAEAKCGFAISNAEMNMEKYLKEQMQHLKS